LVLVESSPKLRTVGLAILLRRLDQLVGGCRSTGPQELTEGQLPASQQSVDPEDLGEDFDPEYFAESEYGLQH
jgi:hypothetical protein